MLMNKSRVGKSIFYCLLLTAFCLLATSCRYDMQDQPRYKVYKQSDWFQDGRASRELPEGTVPRGHLRENAALYTGKIEGATGTAQTNEAGQQITFPDKVTEIPIAVTAETLDRGERQYKIYCGLCHGNFGNGDGMIVRRGFPKPPSYNDDRLRNAPVGHFFDVASNGWGKMNGYSAQVSVSDRWAIVAYIRALQKSQNPSGAGSPTSGTPTASPATTPATTPAATPNNTNSNVKTTTTPKSANTGGNK
jgi:mono/diheme cytochrome c family protein